MSLLSLALYCEGNTDERFLPPVLEKTTKRILDEYKRNNMQVLVRLIEVERKKRGESILEAAHKAWGNHILIVHADADDPRADKAWYERFEPGFKLVQQAPGGVCRNLLPIIPVQAIEAWMLADYELLLAEIGTGLRANELNLPMKVGQVETIAKPKRRLEEVVRRAYATRTRRRREINIDFLYQPMGENIRLERLDGVPAYRQFVDDLIASLQTLNIIPIMYEL